MRAFFVAICLAVVACAEGSHPFNQVLICHEDQSSLQRLHKDVTSFASSNELKWTDFSEQTPDGLRLSFEIWDGDDLLKMGSLSPGGNSVLAGFNSIDSKKTSSDMMERFYVSVLPSYRHKNLGSAALALDDAFCGGG